MIFKSVQPPLGGQKSLILATPLLVGPTQYAMKETGQLPVSVCLVFKAILMLNVSPSARSTRSAHQTWRAYGKSVRIPVPGFVAPTPLALSTTTIPFASAILVMKGIPSPIATERQHVSKN